MTRYADTKAPSRKSLKGAKKYGDGHEVIATSPLISFENPCQKA